MNSAIKIIYMCILSKENALNAIESHTYIEKILGLGSIVEMKNIFTASVEMERILSRITTNE